MFSTIKSWLRIKLFAVVLPFLAFSPSFANRSDPLQTVPYVDLEQYAGLWYELASFPKWFSRNCVNSQATYSFREDGRVGVLNECRKRTADGRKSAVKGVARVVDEESNAKLKVKFGWVPFEGDYWIIELDNDYQYAVISEPSRDSLWILSRTKTLPPETLEEILERLQTIHGMDVLRLEFTRRD